MDQPVVVIARARAKSGLEDAARQEMERLLAPTRAEAGCINYDLHQSPSDSRDFLFHETWKTFAHLEAHRASAHLKAWRAAAPKLVEGNIEVTTWTKLP